MICHSCKGDFAYFEMNQVDHIAESLGYKKKPTLIMCNDCMNRRLSIKHHEIPTIKSCLSCRHAVDGKANNTVGSSCLWACRSLDQWRLKDATPDI